jgi:hypothetical protein
MYDKNLASVGTTAGASVLPFTGLNIVWLVVAAILLLVVGGAVLFTQRGASHAA